MRILISRDIKYIAYIRFTKNIEEKSLSGKVEVKENKRFLLSVLSSLNLQQSCILKNLIRKLGLCNFKQFLN